MNVLLQDMEGNLVPLALYNVAPGGQDAADAMPLLTETYAVGTEIAIAEPFYKIAIDGSCRVRVDSPSEVRLVRGSSDGVDFEGLDAERADELAEAAEALLRTEPPAVALDAARDSLDIIVTRSTVAFEALLLRRAELFWDQVGGDVPEPLKAPALRVRAMEASEGGGPDDAPTVLKAMQGWLRQGSSAVLGRFADNVALDLPEFGAKQTPAKDAALQTLLDTAAAIQLDPSNSLLWAGYAGVQEAMGMALDLMRAHLVHGKLLKTLPDQDEELAEVKAMAVTFIEHPIYRAASVGARYRNGVDQ